MDESTFETFDEELGTPLQDVSPPKPLRQTRRPEMYSQRRVREEPPVVQQVPKSVPIETPISRGMSLRKALSMQNVTQIEPPWEGVTLNRCLFIAITILVLASGCQRLHEFLRGRKVGTDVDVIDAALNMKHSALKKSHLLAPEMETSLWDTFFSWLSDDDEDDEDEDDEEEGSRRDKLRKATRGRATRGLRHKTIPDRKLLKNREGRQKGRRGKTRPDKDETKTKVKAQRETVKRPKEKKMEKEREQETEKKKIKESVKKAGLKIGKKDIKQKST